MSFVARGQMERSGSDADNGPMLCSATRMCCAVVLLCSFVSLDMFQTQVPGRESMRPGLFTQASSFDISSGLPSSRTMMKFPGYLSPSAGLKFADVPNPVPSAASLLVRLDWGQQRLTGSY